MYNNRVYNNQNYICNKYQTNPCRITDGMGIIIDNNITYSYTGRVQVYNNISYNNGGPGISVYHSQHVDIFNNTTYENDISATMSAPFQAHTAGGEITLLNANDARVLNNISYGSASVPMIRTGLTTVTGLVWDYNILFNGIGAARGALMTWSSTLCSSPLPPSTSIFKRVLRP